MMFSNIIIILTVLLYYCCCCCCCCYYYNYFCAELAKAVAEKAKVVSNPHKELFLWSLLLNRMDMADAVLAEGQRSHWWAQLDDTLVVS
jgi:hypothetical protein